MKWWDYMERVHEVCSSYITEECSKIGLKYIGVDFNDVDMCVFKSFKDKDYSKADNTIL